MEVGQHIRYADSDDECGQSSDMHASTNCENFAGAPRTAPHTALSLLTTVNADYDTHDQCYVLQLAHIPAPGLVAAALSNRRLMLYSLSEAALRFFGELHGHEGTIRDLQGGSQNEPNLVHAACSDGRVCGWDLRSGQVVESYSSGAETVCCSRNDAFVAAGSRDKVLLWDRRASKLAASYSDTHAQEVTQVAFHPVQVGALISGSEDGLIAVFDVSGPLDEDEGFRSALNIDTAVAKLGFYGPSGENLWCCSGTESLHLWEWAASCDDSIEGGNGPLGEARDARERLMCAIASGGSRPADYLVQCEYDAVSDQLSIVAGTNEGFAGMFPVTAPRQNTSSWIGLGSPRSALWGGHSDVIRSMVRLTDAKWLSGGEDARLCLWGPVVTSTDGVALTTPAVSSGSEGIARRGRENLNVRRASPY
jgi:WD repeat-containing protein 89